MNIVTSRPKTTVKRFSVSVPDAHPSAIVQFGDLPTNWHAYVLQSEMCYNATVCHRFPFPTRCSTFTRIIEVTIYFRSDEGSVSPTLTIAHAIQIFHTVDDCFSGWHVNCSYASFFIVPLAQDDRKEALIRLWTFWYWNWSTRYPITSRGQSAFPTTSRGSSLART